VAQAPTLNVSMVELLFLHSVRSALV